MIPIYPLSVFTCSGTTLIGPDGTRITRPTWMRSLNITTIEICLYAYCVQNVHNYGLTTADYYYITLIPKYCNFDACRLYMF